MILPIVKYGHPALRQKGARIESVTPAINLAPGALKVGDKIMGVVTGEVDGQHYFFEKYLIIGKC